MTIAERKYAENIAEYVIYMWQMQDLLRAVNMDVESLDGFLRSFLPTEEKIQEEKEWFEGLAKSMKRSGAEEKGNVEEVQEVISELNLLHTTLNTLLRDEEYIAANERAKENLDAYRERTNGKALSEVEAYLTALYGLMILRLRKQEISEETKDAMKTFSDVMVLLALQYNKMKKGESVQHLN
jgi:chromosome segregation ATPase